MIISRVVLKNWRNFLNVDVTLGDRVFIVDQMLAVNLIFWMFFDFYEILPSREVASKKLSEIEEEYQE